MLVAILIVGMITLLLILCYQYIKIETFGCMQTKCYHIVIKWRDDSMAEFCLSRWNKINNTHLSERDVIISKDLDLCDGCGKVVNVVIGYVMWFKRMKRCFA